MRLRPLGAAAVLLTALLAAPVRAPAATLPRLTTSGTAITDTAGRTVLLRGVNVTALTDYAVNDPALPVTQPLDETDFRDMAALGFDAVRLNLSWSALEPTPGAFDQAYVAKIRRAVGQAAAAGIYTVLDMHQDAWGKTVGTPANATCPALFPERSIGWDGAPGWATYTGGLTTCHAAGVREISPAVAAAFQNFYDDRAGIQDHLVRTWARLAAAFAGDPAVAGYDLLNEPNPGLLPPPADEAQLGRFHQRVTTAIRAAEKRAGGFPHLVVYEPSVLWSALSAYPLPPKPSGGPVVLSPHLYAGSIGIGDVQAGFRVATAAAKAYGVPLWTGEWGWFGDPAADGPKVAEFGAAEDAARIGGAWWVWKQSCGNPHALGATVSPSLNRYACPAGTDLGRPAEFTGPLSRAYPRAAPGELRTLTSDGAALTLTGRAATATCGLDLWIPGTARPALTTANVTAVRLRQVPGGWRATGCAAGDYRVSTA